MKRIMFNLEQKTLMAAFKRLRRKNLYQIQLFLEENKRSLIDPKHIPSFGKSDALFYRKQAFINSTNDQIASEIKRRKYQLKFRRSCGRRAYCKHAEKSTLDQRKRNRKQSSKNFSITTKKENGTVKMSNELSKKS